MSKVVMDYSPLLLLLIFLCRWSVGSFPHLWHVCRRSFHLNFCLFLFNFAGFAFYDFNHLNYKCTYRVYLYRIYYACIIWVEYRIPCKTIYSILFYNTVLHGHPSVIQFWPHDSDVNVTLSKLPPSCIHILLWLQHRKRETVTITVNSDKLC